MSSRATRHLPPSAVTEEDEGRRLCADRPQGIPHLVDAPRAQRCDQHRAQRHKWSDANNHRKKKGLPPKEWVPDPLTPDRRREALLLFADDNARRIIHAARELGLVTERLQPLAARLPAGERQHLIVGLARLNALKGNLEDIANLLGWPRPPATSDSPQTPPR